jgi:putative two-component system response regulator
MNLGKILILDDDKINLHLLKSILNELEYQVFEAESSKSALDIIAKEKIDLIITDLMMPEIDGYEFTQIVKENPLYSSIPIIMLTSMGDRKDKITAFKAGVDDFLNKPVDKTELTLRVKGFLKVKKYNDVLNKEKEDLQKVLSEKESVLIKTLDNLNEMREDKTFLIKLLEEESLKLLSAYRELKETNSILKKNNLDIIESLATAAEFRDNETGMHIKRMTNYSILIARKIGLSEDQCEVILNTAAMHDLGKIGIPDNILLKPGQLNDDEWKIMKTHPYIGYKILNGIKNDIMNTASIIAYTHHEKWNGEGYPRQLKGKEIPLEGRICAIGDVFDALTSNRVYKPAFPVEKAVNILKEGRGSHFDPELIDIFLNSIDDVLAIKEKYREIEDELKPNKERLKYFLKNIGM